MIIYLGLITGFAYGDVIQNVLVEGNRFVSDQEILDIVETQPGEDHEDPSTILTYRNDIKAIFGLGYFTDVTAISVQNEDRVDLIFQVVEKPKIVEIRYEGNERYKPKRLNEKIEYDPEQRLFADEDTAESLVNKALTYYTEQSFPNTVIDWRYEEGPEENTRVLVMEIKEGKRLPVREIVIEGNEALSDKQIRKGLETKESWWFLIKNHFNETQANFDLQRIQRKYWEIGHLDATAELLPVEEIDDGLKVTFVVDEGEPYTIGDIHIEGNSIYSTEEILSRFEIKPGDRFTFTRVEESEQELIDLYWEQGYLDVTIPLLWEQWRKDPENLIADLRIRIDENQRKYLGNVEIQGVVTINENTPPIPVKEGEFRTKEHVIRREFEFEEGEPLDWTKVVETDRELVNTGLFKTRGFGSRDRTNLLPGFQRVETSDESVENLLLQLEEEDTGLLSFGGGFSTTFGPSVFASYTEKNIFGYGIRGTITGEIGEFRNRAVLSLFDPHVLNSDYSLDWDIFFIDTQSFGGRRFDEQRVGTSVTVGDEITDEISLLYGFKIEEADLQPASAGRGALDPSTIPTVFNIGTNLTTSLLWGFVYDTRDFDQDPSDGMFSRSTIEVAGLTDNEFVKFSTENNFYHELMETFVLALSTDLDLAYAYGDPGFIPLQERFFVGGARSIRGFDEGSIGQSAVIGFRDPAIRGFRTFLGGEAAFVGSAEVRYPFSELLQGVVFLDYGTVWPEIEDIDPSDFRVSTGAGIRVRIPGFNNALLRLDFGVPIIDEPTDETEFFHFGFSQAF